MSLLIRCLVLLCVLFSAGHCVPRNGKSHLITMDLVNEPKKEVSPLTDCFNIGLFTGSTITVKGNAKTTMDASITLKVSVFRTVCANLPSENCRFCPPADKLYQETYLPVATSMKTSGVEGYFNFLSSDAHNTNSSWDTCTMSQEQPTESLNTEIKAEKTEAKADTETTVAPDKETTATPELVSTVVTTVTTTVAENGTVTKKSPTVVKRAADDPALPSEKQKQPSMTINTESGVYVIQVMAKLNRKENAKAKGNITAHLSIQLDVLNPHGYLSAVDFPALVFYGIMTGVYALYAIAWLISLGCNYTDLVRLQFWVLGVVILGFLEKALFLAEYDQANQGNNIQFLIILAVTVSALKRALSRMLLVIVALGYGIVKPRLGDSLAKVVGAGVIYWLLATINGILRARNETAVSNDTSVLLSYGLLILVDLGIMFWIFSATVETRRALRIRKNFVKLSSYNHFAYTLIFSIVAALGFIIWDLFAHIYPANGCLRDWGEVWLHDCFWHVLFAIILGIIMIIWRPGANKKRFAYSLVDDEETDDHIEQGRNKNFDSVKLRQVGSTSEPPPPSTQAEDDLRWVEENLPTSAIDKALPLILDSDEELMTTKFETSKMN